MYTGGGAPILKIGPTFGYMVASLKPVTETVTVNFLKKHIGYNMVTEIHGLGVDNRRDLWVTSLGESSALFIVQLYISENWTSRQVTQSHIPDLYSIDHGL